MNFLITGGAGSVGRDIAASLRGKGHAVRILDKAPCSLRGVQTIAGNVGDAAVVRRALEGIDTVVHLAWSFSDAPLELIEDDLKSHVVLLDACVAAKLARFFYASSAIVYGKPLEQPITEASRCVVEEARKPFYAAAKVAAEDLALAYWKAQGLPVTVIRFWWSYGGKISGKHLRDMLATAQRAEPLKLPEDAGGSFLDHEDLAHALLLAAGAPRSVGQIFNLATLYLDWVDIAHLITRVSGSSSPVDVVPAREWRGPQFLADRWQLSTDKAARLFGYRSLFSPANARQRLEGAINRCRQELAEKLPA